MARPSVVDTAILAVLKAVTEVCLQDFKTLLYSCSAEINQRNLAG